MTREERCKLAIERGFTYNPETGEVYSRYGKISKSMHKNGYIIININLNKKSYHLLAHNFAWYCINKECVEEIDHINRIRNDNRICNLRAVNKNQNKWNRLVNKGYYFDKKKQKWKSRISVYKQCIFLGCFNTEQEARNAYLQAKEKYHAI
jgi:hypothetical protein